VTWAGQSLIGAKARSPILVHTVRRTRGPSLVPLHFGVPRPRGARCSETRPFIHLRKHPERRAAAKLSVAPAVTAARSRRVPGLYVCAVAHTPFLSALSAESGRQLRMTRMADRSGSALSLRTSTQCHCAREGNAQD